MSNKLARGMGSFLKSCECRRPSGCPHLYTVRFRNARGKQAEESGFSTQNAAIERLTELYTARKTTPRSIAEQQETLGEMIFEEYAKAWFARKRGLTGSTKAATEARMRTHAYPEIDSWKMAPSTRFCPAPCAGSGRPWRRIFLLLHLPGPLHAGRVGGLRGVWMPVAPHL